MCTLHLFFQVFSEFPVVFAVNRDELLDRPWEPPQVLSTSPVVFGPRDVLAGGTWLGVNEHGVLAGLANHFGTLSRPETPSYCSRGAVVLDALQASSAREGAAAAERTAPACKSYTLLVADPEAAFVVQRTPSETSVFPLAAGCHAVTNAPFRHPADPKAPRVLRRMDTLASAGGAPGPAELTRLLADHDTDCPEATPVCIHPAPDSRFGTSSASAIRIRGARGVESFFFAPGPPCTTPFGTAKLPAALANDRAANRP